MNFNLFAPFATTIAKTLSNEAAGFKTGVIEGS
jgi:hypothetical protein